MSNTEPPSYSNNSRNPFYYISIFLMAIGGASIKTALTCKPHTQAALRGAGMLILIPTGFALFSGGYMVHSMNWASSKWGVVMGAVLWASVVFTIDYVFLVAMRSNQFQRMSLLIRFAVSFVIAIAVSHPITLAKFSNEIKSEKEKDLIAELESLNKRRDDTENSGDQRIDSRIAKFDNDLIEVNSRISQLRLEFENPPIEPTAEASQKMQKIKQLEGHSDQLKQELLVRKQTLAELQTSFDRFTGWVNQEILTGINDFHKKKAEAEGRIAEQKNPTPHWPESKLRDPKSAPRTSELYGLRDEIEREMTEVNVQIADLASRIKSNLSVRDQESDALQQMSVSSNSEQFNTWMKGYSIRLQNLERERETINTNLSKVRQTRGDEADFLTEEIYRVQQTITDLKNGKNIHISVLDQTEMLVRYIRTSSIASLFFVATFFLLFLFLDLLVILLKPSLPDKEYIEKFEESVATSTNQRIKI